MNGRLWSFARALAGMVATVALVGGVPFLLITMVGNPFPSDVPSIDEIRILLTQNGQGFTNFIIGTLAVLIWLIWIQIVVAILVEVFAVAQNREARVLPTLPGIQPLAARLVASITLATTLAAAPLLAPAVGALNLDSLATTATVSSAHIVDVASGSADSAAALAEASPFVPHQSLDDVFVHREMHHGSSVDTTAVVVGDHTELWDLADAAYGDGLSWKTIAEANAGRVDAVGSPITQRTQSVPPQTELLLPAVTYPEALGALGLLNESEGETHVDRASTAALQIENEIVATHVVAQGESMWSVAEDRVERRLERPAAEGEVAAYWIDLVAANQQVPSGDVDLIHPGDELLLPDDTTVVAPTAASSETVEPVIDLTAEEIEAVAPVDAARASSSDSAGARAPDSLGSMLGPSAVVAEEAAGDVLVPPGVAVPSKPSDNEVALGVSQPQDLPLPALGLTAFGTAMFSAGLVAALRRRRDLQRRTRVAGTIARPPSTDAAAFEAALVHASDELRESSLGLGWRMLPASSVAAMRASGPLEVRANPNGDVAAIAVIDEEQGPTRVALIDETGPRNARDIQTEIQQLLAQLPAPPPAPATPADVGPPFLSTSITIGTEALSSEAVLVDLGPSDLLALEGSSSAIARFARSVVLDLAVSDRADDVCVIALGAGAEASDLERVRVVDSFPSALQQAMRCGHASPHSATPVVVVSAVVPEEDDESLAELVALGAAVISPGITARIKLALSGDSAVLFPSRTRVEVAALAEDQYRHVAELIETTSMASSQPVDPGLQIDDVIDVVSADECPVEPGPVEVRILGPVEIEGAAHFSSLKAVDVLAYLAFHRHGVDADQIKTWVWPPFEPPTDKAFANVLSRARTALGADADGSPYLSRAGADKTYRLSEVVTTDFDRFRALVALADAAASVADELARLKQALELIRGVPFTGGAASSFAWADNHVRAQVEYAIDEAVHRCADLALEHDDLTTARWAALKGLELVPGCEQCFRRRFLVARAGNNRTELRRAMADLEASAAIELGEPEAVDLISGELLDLYHELDQALVAGTA